MDRRKTRSSEGWSIVGLFAVLILGFTLIVWWKEKSGGSCSNQTQSQNSINPDTSAQPSGNALTIPSEGASPQKTDQATAYSENYFCLLITPANLPSDYLAIVGMGGVFVAVFSLSAIKRQNRSIHHQAVQVKKQTLILNNSAEATQKAAEAALLNAKVAIGSERPWLLIPIGESGVGVAIHKPYMSPAGAILYDKSPMRPAKDEPATHCIFSTKNYGNTPGQVFASKVELQLGDSPVQPPDAHVYSTDGAQHNVVTVPPKEAIATQAFLADPVGLINGEDQQKVLCGGKYLWLCGFVKYRDTFEGHTAREYETRFCYLYENRFKFTVPEPFWKPAGPSEYNQAT